MLTFNRPEARNAMTWSMYAALPRPAIAPTTDSTVRVLVLRGAVRRKAFVAGTDISQFQAFREPARRRHRLLEKRLDAALDRLRARGEADDRSRSRASRRAAAARSR